MDALIELLGGAYKAAAVAEITPAWMYRCIERGYLPAPAAYRLLLAAEEIEPGRWPISRLAELTVDAETIACGE